MKEEDVECSLNRLSSKKNKSGGLLDERSSKKTFNGSIVL